MVEAAHPALISRLLHAAVWLVGGFAAFLPILSRGLMHLPESLTKRILIASVGLSMTVGPALYGYFTGWSPATVAPVGATFLLVLAELQLARERKRQRGAPALETSNLVLTLARPITTTQLKICRFETKLRGWMGKPFRVALLSDLHVSEALSKDYYRGVFERVYEASPDLLLMTGDFVTNAACVSRLPSVLDDIGKRMRTYAVLGNHDYWAGAQAVARILSTAGIELLRHGYRRVIIGDRALLICGCEQPWNAAELDLPQRWDGEPVLVLTHTADNIYRLSESGANAVFAGHYHAGQIKLPWIGPLVIPSIYGRRFDHGHFVVNGTELFVTAGVGLVGLPFRIYCQPDFFLVDFKPAF